MQANLGPYFWLTKWNWQPSIIIGTIVIMILYLYAVGPFRVKHHLAEDVKTSQVWMFMLGVYVIFFSLFSPIDFIGDQYLFSVHMVQHLFLTIVGPPLMILGTPAWLVKPLLRRPLIFQVGRFLANPFVAFFLFNANFWLWHAPPLYDATLVNDQLHILEHLTFIGLGVLYWWPVFSPLKEGWPRLPIGGQILYIFLGGMPSVLLGAGLTFVPPLYLPYIYAPRLWGLSPATDQQLGGLIMWVPGSILSIIYVSILFIHWMQTQDAKQQREEALRYAEDEQEEDETPIDAAKNVS